jgi:hypothetical protein
LKNPERDWRLLVFIGVHSWLKFFFLTAVENIVGNPERGVTRISGDQAGVAFSPSRRSALKLQKERTIDSFFCHDAVKN